MTPRLCDDDDDDYDRNDGALMASIKFRVVGFIGFKALLVELGVWQGVEVIGTETRHCSSMFSGVGMLCCGSPTNPFSRSFQAHNKHCEHKLWICWFPDFEKKASRLPKLHAGSPFMHQPGIQVLEQCAPRNITGPPPSLNGIVNPIGPALRTIPGHSMGDKKGGGDDINFAEAEKLM